MRAIGYIRVSTSMQAVDGVSLEVQRTRIAKWCEANEYRLASVHTDAGLSGKRADNRPELQRALKAACDRRGTALVVYSLSRLARSTKDAISIAEQLDKAGADLVSLSERLDTTSAAGKMIFRLLAVFAEFERDLVSERTTAAMATKRANGQRIGTIPYGWNLADDGETLVEEAVEQSVITDIKAMRSRGRKLQQIADCLTSRGVPTKTGKSTRWTHQAVARILERRNKDRVDVSA